MKKLSIIASTLVLSCAAYAANNVDEAFKNGKVSGDVSVHHQSENKTAGTNDSGFTAGSIGLNYETDSLNGFKLNAGFRANHEFSEKEAGDYEGEFENDAVINTANIEYSNDFLTVKVGRQEIDLEWLGDFNEAVVISSSKLIPNTTLVAGYTTRQAAVGVDENKKFADVTKDGAYVIDAKFNGIENVMLNPYYYSAEDVANFYGLKATYETDVFGVTAHYATSSEKVAGQEDGSIAHLEASTKIAGLSLAAGYITTDKDAGVASISAFGDNIDPTEELGDYVYAKDTNTVYATAGYTISDVELSALYAIADNDSSNKEDKELTIAAAYSFTENLAADITYTDLSLESNNDKSKVAVNLAYSF
ncbi:Opr family porin [Arcobacter sp. YIC-464]|uniref:Opr family porin n=1 Tax=Arcobacter sp. YIC-464 TaxID=3376631 RepID=UPI003C283049